MPSKPFRCHDPAAAATLGEKCDKLILRESRPSGRIESHQSLECGFVHPRERVAHGDISHDYIVSVHKTNDRLEIYPPGNTCPRTSDMSLT